jgi:hypothetical protein
MESLYFYNFFYIVALQSEVGIRSKQEIELFCQFLGDQKFKLTFNFLITTVFMRSKAENNKTFDNLKN